MIIVDTSVWIEYLKGSSKVKSSFDHLLQRRKLLAISVVFGELLQGVRNKREREIVTKFWDNLPKMDETDLFIEAGNLSNTNKLFSKGVGLIDCYILAAAIRNDARIWTTDKRMEKAISAIIN